MLNYVLIGIAGVTGTYVLMRAAFAPRRSPLLWYLYFAVKTTVDARLWCALNLSAPLGWVEGFQAAWLFGMGFVSLLVVYRSFAGDFVLVVLCATVCDLFAAICMSLATVVANMACGLPADAAYLNPFGLHSVLTAAGVVALVLCIRVPIGWVLRCICRVARRNRVAWGVATLLLVSFFVSLTQRLSSYVSLNNHWPLIVPLATLVLAVVSLTLARRARDMRRREAMVRQCVELAGSYDHAVRTRLEGLERDLSALEGHDLTLRALGRCDGAASVEAAELQRVYRHLRAGAYCDLPALDAVLSACAQRLDRMGVRSVFTVAAVPVGKVAPATVALALLHLACEAAERADGTEEEVIDLRVRGLGDQVLFRLAVPATWGALWARRFLSAFDTLGAGLVRERVEGDRRVVLVVSGLTAL